LVAHLRLDVDALDRLMAPDCFHVGDGGEILDREAILVSMRSGDRSWEDAHSDEHDVRIYGDTAVVVGRWRARGVNTGQSFDYAACYVSVWVRHEGGWRMVSDQSTPIS